VLLRFMGFHDDDSSATTGWPLEPARQAGRIGGASLEFGEERVATLARAETCVVVTGVLS